MNMELNWIVILATGLVPMFTGFTWYHPKVLGSVWMKEAGVTDEMIKSSNMVKILGLSLLFGIMLSAALTSIVIHQMGVFATLQGVDAAQATAFLTDFMANYGENFRSFKHGALHGFLTGLFIALPVIGMNSLFERKSFKYIFIHAGYWIVTAMIMGGIICAYA
jgi:hypothetical protein